MTRKTLSRKHITFTAAWAATLCTATLWTAAATAAPVCIPAGGTTPYTTGTLSWWRNASNTYPAQPGVRTWTDAGDGSYHSEDASRDTRWLGAMAFSGVYSEDQGTFKAKYVGNDLYLSWDFIDPNFPDTSALSIISLGYVGDDKKGFIVEVRLTPQVLGKVNTRFPQNGVAGDASELLLDKLYLRNTTCAPTDTNFSTCWQEADLSALPAGSDAAKLAAGFKETAVLWTGDHNDDSASESNAWSFQVRIPLNSVGMSTTNKDGRLAYHALVSSGATSLTYTMPWGATLSPMRPSDPSTWQDVFLGTSGSCATTGLTLKNTDINSQTSSDGTTWSANNRRISKHTRFLISTDKKSVTNANQVSAKFRIADWGTSGFSTGANNFRDVPCTPTAALAGSNLNITCQWDMSTAQACQYCKDTMCTGGIEAGCTPQYASHQCIYGELIAGAGTPPPSGPLHFASKSAYINMNTLEASVIEEVASVSVKGLPKVPGRDKQVVYLHIDRDNLPGHGAAAIKGGSLKEILSNRQVYIPRASEDEIQKATDGQGLQPAPLKSEGEALRDGPTITVYPFYDTGKTQLVNGAATAVLEAMPAFGIHAHHEGALYGWTASAATIDPAISVTALVPDTLYRVEIPNDGVAKLKFRIEAHDKPLQVLDPKGSDTPTEEPVKVPAPVPHDEICNCRVPTGHSPASGLAVVGAMALLGLAVRRRRRR